MNTLSIAARIRENTQKRLTEKLAASPVITKTFGDQEFRVRRLNLQDWSQSGRLPQYLTTMMLRAYKGEAVEVDESAMSADEMAASLVFQREAFCESIVEPRFVQVDRPLADDEVSYKTFTFAYPEIVREVVEWQMAGAPGVPVESEGGEVPLQSLETFRNKGKRGVSPKSRTRKPAKRGKTVGTPRHP